MRMRISTKGPRPEGIEYLVRLCVLACCGCSQPLMALSYRSGQPALTSGNGVRFPVAKWPQIAQAMRVGQPPLNGLRPPLCYGRGCLPDDQASIAMQMTKHMVRAASVAAIALGIWSGSPSAQTSYPLVCRGRANMNVFVSRGYTSATPGSRYGWAVTVSFDGASRSAVISPPGPGECAWLDRGFRPGEPKQLLMEIEEPVSITYRPGEEIFAVGTVPSAAGEVVSNLHAGRVVHLHVRTCRPTRPRRSRCLLVTRYGP